MPAIVVGSFLPWLQSGTVRKNSYQLAGYGDRRSESTLPADLLMRAWPLLGVLCAVTVVLVLVRRHRAAAVLSVGIAFFAVLAVGAGLSTGLSLESARIQVRWEGPLVTLGGAMALAGAALLRARH